MKTINTQNTKLLSLLMAVLMPVTLLTGCGKNNEDLPISKSGFYLDTYITITLYEDKDRSEEIIDDCFNEVSHYEKLFSNTIEGSDIWNINHSPHEYITVDDATAELINIGLEYSKASDGAFDITVGNLSALWDFKNNTGKIPNKEKIKEALASVSYENIKIDGNNVMLDSDSASIDLGGIAKGYIADRLKEYLINKGITSGLINLGGNVLSVGPRADGKSPYTIGLQKPFADDGKAIGSLAITDESVVTSGTYQRYFEKDDKIYHHILDLNTGYPADNDLTSVTIISKKSVDGDALSTTVFLMGQKKGLSFVENIPDTEAIFVDTDGKITFTSGVTTKYPFKELK